MKDSIFGTFMGEMVRWVIFIVVYILIDLYAFQALKTVTRSVWIKALYVLSSTGILLALIYLLNFGETGRVLSIGRMYVFGFFLALFVPKVILLLIMFGEDIFRIFAGFFYKLGITGGQNGFYMPSRRKFISSAGMVIAAIPFTSLLYGMYTGRYNYKVLNYTLEFDDLPQSFDGYKITQISDIHSGSFDNEEKVRYAVKLVNEQKGDIILFTGDLVNNVANEMKDWKDLFATLKAKDGVYSVLGNHDYGDYAHWKSEEEKTNNLNDLKKIQAEMGWDLLLNENRQIHRNNEKITLIGVENWGAGGFKKAGDLDMACEGVSKEDFKIVMSHDPSHWQMHIKEDPRNFQFTLSGHTHGMQFGIEIPGWIKWSPVKYRYENWAGIYQEMGRYLNVNRGFGYLGYPGRVGIWPEISVVTLKKKRDTA